MLLEGKIVYVPSLAERDADRNEYGQLSNKTRAQFGEAAVTAGDPDHEGNEARTSAVDTVANILHWLWESGDPDPESALGSALGNFRAEHLGES